MLPPAIKKSQGEEQKQSIPKGSEVVIVVVVVLVVVVVVVLVLVMVF